jgi:predicted nucleic acid-binding protein
LPPSPVRLRRLFLDANVLFAACWQEGRARALLKLAPRAEVLLLTSPHALEEARRNLEAKRPEALDCLRRIREQVQMVPEAPMALVRKAYPLRMPLSWRLPGAPAPRPW